jgi:hypothetical protein
MMIGLMFRERDMMMTTWSSTSLNARVEITMTAAPAVTPQITPPEAVAAPHQRKSAENLWLRRHWVLSDLEALLGLFWARAATDRDQIPATVIGAEAGLVAETDPCLTGLDIVARAAARSGANKSRKQ